jgi:hypothetical protein
MTKKTRDTGVTTKAKQKESKIVYSILSVGIIGMIGVVIFFTTSQDEQPVPASARLNNYAFVKNGELTFLSEHREVLASIDIQIAETESQRMVGLMYRDFLGVNQGMLFLFPVEEEQSFWMKNTRIPLDIIFVNAKMEIVKIHHTTKPFSEEGYPSERVAMYVVETNGGYTEKNNIHEGCIVSWKRANPTNR